MKMDFADAMHAATQLTRAQKLTEATRLIQGALLLGRGQLQSEPPNEQVVESQTIEQRLVDLAPQVTQLEFEVATWPMGNGTATLHQPKLPSFGLDGLSGVRHRKALKIPDGAQFLGRSYAGVAGSRSYKLYIPHRRHAVRPRLLVMLHGGTQDADDFAAGTRMNALAEEHGLIVAYPNQCRSANATLCWNWFKPEDQMRGSGEPFIIAAITSEIAAAYDIDPECVYVAGLSAGGAMAAVMGATYPELYAAVGVHSGLAYKSATDVVSAFAAMRGDTGLRYHSQRKSHCGANNDARVRTIVFHGTADRIVHPSNAEKIIKAQAKIGDSVERANTRSSAGRAYSRSILRDKTGSPVVAQWLIHGSGHAWSGGSADGTYTDPHGPDASREMLRFFFEEPPMSRDD